ncbi:MAG TPA: hypothetical protein VGS12_11190 [Caulobacteraceae bacterium]|nr:hypothetical protein [Caulobacteraceae bacterium]
MSALHGFAVTFFSAIRTVHVLAATLWAFTTIAPFRFYVRPTLRAYSKNPNDPEIRRRRDWVLEQFDRTVIIEHVAFVVILLTGPLLFISGAASFHDLWFAVKIAIVVAIFIPIEVYDVWLSHIAAPRETRRKEQDPARYDLFRRRYVAFLRGVTPLILLTVPTVLILALAKP